MGSGGGDAAPQLAGQFPITVNGLDSKFVEGQVCPPQGKVVGDSRLIGVFRGREVERRRESGGGWVEGVGNGIGLNRGIINKRFGKCGCASNGAGPGNACSRWSCWGWVSGGRVGRNGGGDGGGQTIVVEY